jgi:peptidoglycan-associated lipoprotein
MGFHNTGFKAVSVAAAMFLLAACETPVEESADTSGTGTATQTTQAETKPVETKPMEKEMKPKGPVPGSQEDLVLNVGDRVFFDFDKSDLKPDARATIERWAAWLKQYPSVTVTIEGHCDERGTREYNIGLGERRSDSARRYLVALGVNPDRIATVSYGKERPVCVTSNESCWSQNRRGVMVVN